MSSPMVGKPLPVEVSVLFDRSGIQEPHVCESWDAAVAQAEVWNREAGEVRQFVARRFTFGGTSATSPQEVSIDVWALSRLHSRLGRLEGAVGMTRRLLPGAATEMARAELADSLGELIDDGETA